MFARTPLPHRDNAFMELCNLNFAAAELAVQR
jgi:hypothetical protein